MARARFSREPADKRRRALIEACAALLARRGVAGASVRSICAEAGVSPGLLRHYFSGIGALIAATYVHVGDRVAVMLAEATATAGPDPRDRLLAYVQANFHPSVANSDLLATWIALWSLLKADPAIADLHGNVYAGFRKGIEELGAECGVPPSRARLMGIAVTALIDGLWLELCLDPTTFSAEEASAIAKRWVDDWLP
jgi:AcrR family transcriptional regulator